MYDEDLDEDDARTWRIGGAGGSDWTSTRKLALEGTVFRHQKHAQAVHPGVQHKLFFWVCEARRPRERCPCGLYALHVAGRRQHERGALSMHDAIYHLRCNNCHGAYLSVPGDLLGVCFACDEVNWQLVDVFLRPRTPWEDAPGNLPRLFPVDTPAGFLERLADVTTKQDVSAPPKHRSALGGACSWLTCARG